MARRLDSAPAPSELSLRVVIAGPLPPPYGGVTGFVELLRMHASRAGQSVAVFDTSTHSDVARSGTWSLTNLMRAGGLLPRMAIESRWARPSVIQIEAGGYLGLVKSAALAHASAGTPVVLSIHSADMSADLAQAGRAGRFLIRRALRRSGAVRVMYQDQLDELAALAPEVPLNRYRIIRPFIEAQPRATPETTPSGALRLVSVGTVGVRKGTFELLRALAAVRATGRLVHCDVFGAEERASDMRKLTDFSAKLRLGGSVTLHGAVPSTEVRRHMEEADAFVLPSRAEGLPLALMEAMSMGLPLVVTAVGAIPDTVHQPELHPLAPGDPQALKAALIRLADDPGLRARCADANVRRTREYLSPDVVVPLYVDMWRMAAHPAWRFSAAPSSDESRSAS